MPGEDWFGEGEGEEAAGTRPGQEGRACLGDRCETKEGQEATALGLTHKGGRGMHRHGELQMRAGQVVAQEQVLGVLSGHAGC